MTAAKSGEVKAALKELVEEFLDTGYGPLMESVKRAFVRESDRLLPSDLIQMMYLSAFCMQYHRLRLEDAIKRGRVAAQQGAGAAVTNFDIQLGAGVAVTLDLWSFRFYTKNIVSYLDRKEWVQLGIAVAAFKEMIMSVYRMRQSGSPECQAWSGRLIRVVFYEREIMDLVPQLLARCDESRKYVASWFITDLVETAHAVLAIGHKMAEDHHLVRTRKRKRRSRKKKKAAASARAAARRKRWTKEQIFALEEGVRSLGLHKWEQISRHPQFGGAVGNRSPDDIMEKWEAVVKVREAGGDIESDPEIEEPAAEADEDAQGAAAGGAGADGQKGEKGSDSDSDDGTKDEDELFDEREFQFDAYLKKFQSNTVVRVYIRLLQLYRYNAPRVNHCIVKLLHRLSTLEIGDGVGPKGERTRATAEPQLFQVFILELFDRIMHDRQALRDVRFRELIGFCKATTRHYLRALKANPLLLVESLFWRSRRMQQHLQNGYRDPSGGGGGSDRKAGAAGGRGAGAAVTAMDQEGENEADLDADALGDQANAAAGARAKNAEAAMRRRRKAKRWTDHEDALLIAKFPSMAQTNDKDVCYQVLALEDLLAANDRTPDQVARRVKHLKLDRRGQGGGNDALLGVNANMLNSNLKRLLLNRLLPREIGEEGEGDLALDVARAAVGSAAASNDDVRTAEQNRKCLLIVENALAACAASRRKREELRDAQLALADSGDEDNAAINQVRAAAAAHSSVAFAIVPGECCL